MPSGTQWVVVLLLVSGAEVNAGTILEVSGPVDYSVAAPYPPASGSVISFQDDLLVDVTSTPEPGALAMMAECLLAGLILRRRARGVERRRRIALRGDPRRVG
jgi:hypothetical protein